METSYNAGLVGVSLAFALIASCTCLWFAARAVAARGLAANLRAVLRTNEDRLAISEQRFDAVADSVGAMVWMADNAGRTGFVSQALREFLGAGSDAEIGEGWYELLDPEEGARLRSTVATVQATRQSVDLWLQVHNPAGAQRWLQARAVPLSGSDGRPRGVMGLLIDITGQRSAYDELERSDAFKDSVLDGMSYALVVSTLDGRITTFNRGAERLFGYDGAQARASVNVMDLYESPPEAQRARAQRLAQDASAGVCEAEMTAIRRDGTRVPVAASLTAMRAPDGSLIGMLSIVQDISERKRAERALRESELKFRTLYEAAPVAIIRTDAADWRLIEANPGFFRMTGYERTDLASVNPVSIASGGTAEETARVLADLVRKGAYGPIERECQRKDGTRFQVLLNGVAATTSDGRRSVWSIAQDISERKSMETELRRIAHIDRLTGLANRELLGEQLGRCIRTAERFPRYRFKVLYLDIDHFKNINDSLGHAAGDEMLKEVARRLREVLGVSDAASMLDRQPVISRFGGDEFVVLLRGTEGPAEGVRIADRLLSALGAPYRLLDREFHCSVSIGLVSSDDGATTPEGFLRDADTAMYQAKISGRNRRVQFDACMRERVERRVALENDQWRAIGAGQLYLAYQPMVSLASGRIVASEALLRWNHPQYGAVPPCEFIPIAEDTGFILELGDWVLREACRQHADWRKRYGELAPRGISINISRAQLMLDDLAPRIGAILATHGIAPQDVHLEITETAVMRDADVAMHTMRALRALGVRLDLDDFGTGYSSLGSLHQFPIDTIKIDRSFVQRLETDRGVSAVIDAVTRLASQLKLEVVAEGIETPRELELVQQLGCQFGQGFLFSRPLEAAEFEDFFLSGTDSVEQQVVQRA
jgi:Amt family ammonium transporter